MANQSLSFYLRLRREPRNVYNHIVHVYVENGDMPEEFSVHHGRLAQTSPGLKAILAGTKSEEGVILDPDNGSLLMIDVGAETFRRFVHWLYDHKMMMEGETVKDITWDIMIDLYLFATKRGISKLQNHCIDAAILKQKKGKILPNQHTMNKLWVGNTNVAQMRQLFLHLYARECDLEIAIAKNGGFHHRFLQGLVTTFYSMKKEGSTNKVVDFWVQRQKYYVYGDDNPVMLD